MEEDIKIIKNHYVFKTNHVLDDENKQFKQAIENLINRCRELEKATDNYVEFIKNTANDYELLVNENKEQEKVIELMAKELSRKKGMIKKVCGNFNCEECIEMKFEECVIEFFRKKAKGE